MVNITISVPDELKSKMDELPEINWSAVARRSFEEMAASISLIREFKKNSTISEEDAIRWGRKLNARLAKRKNR